MFREELWRSGVIIFSCSLTSCSVTLVQNHLKSPGKNQKHCASVVYSQSTPVGKWCLKLYVSFRPVGRFPVRTFFIKTCHLRKSYCEWKLRNNESFMQDNHYWFYSITDLLCNQIQTLNITPSLLLACFVSDSPHFASMKNQQS